MAVTTTRATDPGNAHRAARGRTNSASSDPRSRSVSPIHSLEVDFKKRASRRRRHDPSEVNLKLRELMSQGVGTIVMKNPGAKHSLAVGILTVQPTIEGSLGYFGCG